ncbi:MAG: hypothetical protein WCL08_00095 [Verrucomicrobiota bacterium]
MAIDWRANNTPQLMDLSYNYGKEAAGSFMESFGRFYNQQRQQKKDDLLMTGMEIQNKRQDLAFQSAEKDFIDEGKFYESGGIKNAGEYKSGGEALDPAFAGAFAPLGGVAPKTQPTKTTVNSSEANMAPANRMVEGESVSVPTTNYSLSKKVGGADESHDSYTDRGFSSIGRNLTPGVVSVNTDVYPLGTVFREPDGTVRVALDRHGNADPNVVDFYQSPDKYTQSKGNRELSVIGRIPKSELPRTPSAVRSSLSKFGRVPEGEDAITSLARIGSGGTTTLAQGI